MVVIKWRFEGLFQRIKYVIVDTITDYYKILTLILQLVLRSKFNFNFRGNIKWRIAQASLTIQSLTYNEHMSQSYAIDFMLEPIFWFVDNFAQYLGRVRIRHILII